MFVGEETTSLSKSRYAMGVPVVVSRKTQEERDIGRISAGGDMPVIAEGDGEQER